MGAYVANEVIRLMVRKGINPVGARILVLGLAFKENCPDLRNTRVVDIVSQLRSYNVDVDVYDPWVDAAAARHEYGLSPLSAVEPGAYDAIVLAVGHREFAELGAMGIRALGKPNAVLYDVKYVLPKHSVDARL
jgi:UDP-N-acetyl-D-galactosamine dehydrogenase